MQASLPEILRVIRDRSSAEGLRFDLAIVLVYFILGAVASDNVRRQPDEFISSAERGDLAAATPFVLVHRPTVALARHRSARWRRRLGNIRLPFQREPRRGVWSRSPSMARRCAVALTSSATASRRR